MKRSPEAGHTCAPCRHRLGPGNSLLTSCRPTDGARAPDEFTEENSYKLNATGVYSNDPVRRKNDWAPTRRFCPVRATDVAVRSQPCRRPHERKLSEPRMMEWLKMDDLGLIVD